MKIKSSLTAVLAVFSLGAMPAGAITTLYTTNFNSPTYSSAGLIGQDSWVLTNSTTNPITVANTAVNGTVTLTTTGQDVRRAFAAQTLGSVFLQANITVGTAQAAGDYFIHLGDNGASNFYARTFIRSSGAGFQMALGTSSGTATYGTTVLSFATTYTILMRYDFVAGLANDTGALFVNPTTADGSGDTAYVTATTTGTDATTISSVSLRQGGATSAPGGVVIDNIVVSAVPEPDAAAFLGALGIFGIFRRRR